MLGVAIVSLLVAVACAPKMESDDNAPAQASAGETASSQSQNGGTGQVVDVTSMSETELAAQPTGRSEPGAGTTTDEGSQHGQEGQGETPEPGELSVYSDGTYKFSVSYPADFVFRIQSAENLVNLQPKPEAAFRIMNPATASSDIVDLEPPDGEIRVHGAGQVSALADWLISNNLLPADGTVPVKPFRTSQVSGVQVCSSTMIAPGCSYFVLGDEWIYQLTPATVEGETMIETFTLMP